MMRVTRETGERQAYGPAASCRNSAARPPSRRIAGEYFSTARPAVEHPPFTTDSALDLIQAVEAAQTISDLDVSTLAFIQRYATCSAHGVIADVVEVSGFLAPVDGYVTCTGCYSDFAIKRRCPVESVGPEEK